MTVVVMVVEEAGDSPVVEEVAEDSLGLYLCCWASSVVAA
jgi:hypothetical protein